VRGGSHGDQSGSNFSKSLSLAGRFLDEDDLLGKKVSAVMLILF